MNLSVWRSVCRRVAGTAIVVFSSLCLAFPATAATPPAYANLPPITAQLSAPVAVAVGPSERIYVAEPSSQRVQVYDAAGGHLASLSGLATPIAIAAAPTGLIYVGQAGRGNVTVYDRALRPVAALGRGDGEFVRPVSMAVDAAGFVYVADAKANEVRVYNPDHSFRFVFGGRGIADGQFSTPTAIAIDELAGEIHVVDLADPGAGVIARIQVFDRNGTFIRRLPVGGRPAGLAVDRAGRLYLSDAYRNTVLVLGSDGAYLGTLSDPLRPLRTPVGLAFAPRSSRLFVASLRSASIEVYGIDDYRLELLADDEDGIPEDWELAHGLDPYDSADADEDPDGDGFSNRQEFEAGSDPRSAASNPGRLRFASDSLSVDEGAGQAVLEVRREGGSVGTATVLCHAVAASAEAGSDFIASQVWLEWADGDDGAKDCAIAIIDDAEVEGDEAFQAGLASPGGALLASPENATVVIVENDRSRAANDFNGDGRSDLLLRDQTTHAWYYYPLGGQAVLDGEGEVALPRDPDWRLVGTADYNGDGKADVLLRHARTHQWHYYPLNGARVLSGAGPFDLVKDPQWQPVGSGDFDGDGRADVLLRHGRTQQWRYLRLDGARVLSDSPVDLPRNRHQLPAGIGDFDGDGRAELLLDQARGGSWRYVQLDGGAIRWTKHVDALSSLRGWQVAGIGDFDGDGGDDLLLRDERKDRWRVQHLVERHGRGVAAGDDGWDLPSPGDWQLAGIGDYDGDGSDELLWRHARTGQWARYSQGDGLAGMSGMAIALDGDWLPVVPGH